MTKRVFWLDIKEIDMKKDYNQLSKNELIKELKDRDSIDEDNIYYIFELEEKIEVLEKMLVMSNKMISKANFREIDKILDEFRIEHS